MWGVLWDSASRGNALWLREMKVTAEALRIILQPADVHGLDDFEPAFSAIKKGHASALSALRNAVTNKNPNFTIRVRHGAARSGSPLQSISVREEENDE